MEILKYIRSFVVRFLFGGAFMAVLIPAAAGFTLNGLRSG
jgi:hypothetical protein